MRCFLLLALGSRCVGCVFVCTSLSQIGTHLPAVPEAARRRLPRSCPIHTLYLTSLRFILVRSITTELHNRNVRDVVNQLVATKSTGRSSSGSTTLPLPDGSLITPITPITEAMFELPQPPPTTDEQQQQHLLRTDELRSSVAVGGTGAAGAAPPPSTASDADAVASELRASRRMSLCLLFYLFVIAYMSVAA